MTSALAEKPPPLLLALAPIAALFTAIVAGVAAFGFSSDLLLVSILLAAFVAGLGARYAGKSWNDIQAATGRRIADALAAILILLSIGALLGSWMFSGTIPLMVALGVDLIDPHFMALTAFVATAMMSIISGTSWGSAGTIGVALMGAAHAMGAPLAPVAGAVISGAYFGDKLSPLSDMTNIAAIGAGADLYKHIRHMLWTSLPPTAIALVVYALIGAFSASSSGATITAAGDVRANLELVYRLDLFAALPLLVALAGVARRYPPALVIIASSVLALIIGIVVQHFPAKAALSTFVAGFDINAVAPSADVSSSLASLLNRGGLFSMAPTLIFIIAAFILAASMEISGALTRLLNALLHSVRSAFGLVAATLGAGAMMVAMTSHGGVTALIVGGLFRDSYRARGLAPENLSRTIEDSATVTEPLMPWTVSGLFMATTLGVATIDYLPWAVFCYLGPLFTLIFASLYEATGWGLAKTKSAETR
ncbi:MAG: Na+/H+ antiporter NhaC [Parvularculaceae bacterium]